MKFVDFFKEGAEEDASYQSNNALSGNVAGLRKYPTLTHTPVEDTNEESDKIEILMKKYDIQLDREVVETVIALVNKTLNDWNRDKNINGDEIEKVIIQSIKDKIIEVK